VACHGVARESRSIGCRLSAPRMAPHAKRAVRRVARVRSVVCPRLRWTSPTRVVQEADEAEGSLGPRDAPGAAPVRSDGVRECLDAVLAVGPPVGGPPDLLGWGRQRRHDRMDPVARDRQPLPAARGEPERQRLPDHDDPPRLGPPPRLADQLGDLKTCREGPEGEAAYPGLQEARAPGGEGRGERSGLESGQDRLVEEGVVGPDEGNPHPARRERQRLGAGRRSPRGPRRWCRCGARRGQCAGPRRGSR